MLSTDGGIGIGTDGWGGVGGVGCGWDQVHSFTHCAVLVMVFPGGFTLVVGFASGAVGRGLPALTERKRLEVTDEGRASR